MPADVDGMRFIELRNMPMGLVCSNCGRESKHSVLDRTALPLPRIASQRRATRTHAVYDSGTNKAPSYLVDHLWVPLQVPHLGRGAGVVACARRFAVGAATASAGSARLQGPTMDCARMLSRGKIGTTLLYRAQGSAAPKANQAVQAPHHGGSAHVDRQLGRRLGCALPCRRQGGVLRGRV
jgi:hypothetical protein